MPLSEHEQQILDDIEQRLTAEDPKFADTVGNTTLATHLAARLRWSIVGFIIGFVLLLCFVINVWIATVGFALMVGCAFVFYLAIKQLGQEQLRVMARSGSLSFPGLVARIARRTTRDEDTSDPHDEPR